MDKEKFLNENFEQGRVNKVWQEVWASSAFSEDTFKNPLFVEGWKVFEKYIPEDTVIVLEAGGGSGRFGLKIAQKLPDSEVMIIDIVDASVDLINKTAEKLGLKNVLVSKDDVLNLSFPDNKFDMVVSDAVIQHIVDDKRAVREMARVLKSGGILIVSAVGKWSPHALYRAWLRLTRQKYEYVSERLYSKKRLRDLIKGAGLEVIAEDGFYPAYGILRHKRRHKIFKLLGRICNRLTKILDSFTNRFFSRNFGFELVVVGRKRLR